MPETQVVSAQLPAVMASDGKAFLEEGAAIQLAMTSEDERAMRPLARWRLLLAGMSSVALIAIFCAIVVSTAQLGSGAAKAGKPELQEPQQNNAWAQEAIQRWLDPGSAQPPKHVVDFQPDDWEVSEVRTLHPDSGTARINAGSDKSEEIPGVIQEWTEVDTAKAIIKETKYFGGSAKDPTGSLYHIQMLFTHTWGDVYFFFGERQRCAPHLHAGWPDYAQAL